jgi:hypothetical protein
MSLISLAKLPLSVDHGWPELARRHPGILKVLGLIALPLWLLRPTMLYFAGTRYPEAFVQATRPRDWATVAAVFFLAEMATFLAMGWLIKQVADTNALVMDYHDAYLLAAIAPVPLWLSSLGLLIPDLITNVTLSITAMGLSCALLFHGLQALGRRRDEVVAAGVVQIVIGAGLIAWALLLALAFV